MRSIKINIPKGYEIDKDKSSFEKIVFKKKDELPKKWKELRKVEGFFIDTDSIISWVDKSRTNDDNRNVFPSEKTAKAGGILLPMLLQLRNRYRDGWKPNWKNDNCVKYIIYPDNTGMPIIEKDYINPVIFAFQSKEIAQQFLNNFKNMLKEYFNALTE